MKILALEFSTERRSVAVLQTGEATEPIVIGKVTELSPRSMAPLSMIEEALRMAGAQCENIEIIAIGLGPGSYAGIRGAISIAQGWQLVREVRLIGVSSVDCLAAAARQTGLRGLVTMVLNAQRNELYVADYEITADAFRETSALRIAPVSEVRTPSTQERIFAGPEVEKWFPAGYLLFPDAATLGMLAAGRTDYLPGEAIQPIYLRETNFVKAPPSRITL